jgi:hypothetical protein
MGVGEERRGLGSGCSMCSMTPRRWRGEGLLGLEGARNGCEPMHRFWEGCDCLNMISVSHTSDGIWDSVSDGFGL